MKLHARHVSVGESGDEYFQVSFDSEGLGDHALDPSGHDYPYLLIQRQFEDDDGGVCYIETHDHDTYTGHFRLKLIESTSTHLAFGRSIQNQVEVTYDLDAKKCSELALCAKTAHEMQKKKF
jgi:hypothetical protein